MSRFSLRVCPIRHAFTTPESWPDTPISLGRQLSQLTAILAEHGVTVTRPRQACERRIRLEHDPVADLSVES